MSRYIALEGPPPIDSSSGGVLYFFGGDFRNNGGGKRARRPSVKLEIFCYNITMKTLELLEKEHHYKIPEKVKKEIAEAVIEQMDSLIES